MCPELCVVGPLYAAISNIGSFVAHIIYILLKGPFKHYPNLHMLRGKWSNGGSQSLDWVYPKGILHCEESYFHMARIFILA